MQAHILGPSRIGPGCKQSIIDDIFLYDLEMECTNGNFYEKISDHIPNFIILENVENSPDKKDEIIIRDMTKF